MDGLCEDGNRMIECDVEDVGILMSREVRRGDEDGKGMGKDWGLYVWLLIEYNMHLSL